MIPPLPPAAFPLAVPPASAFPDEAEDEDVGGGDVAGLAGEQAVTETVTTKAASVAAAAATLRENDMVSILPPRSHNWRRQDATGLVTGHHSTGRDP
jgi:hypothetical protein